MKTKRTTQARGAQKRLAAKKPRPAHRPAGSPVERMIRDADASPVAPKWRWHYRTLVTLRERLLRDRREKLHEAAVETIEPHSLHMADSATDEFDHDMAMTLLAVEQGALSDVEDAIQRIHAGTYGVCLATGKRIPAVRLRAIPWTRYARDAEQRLEKNGVVPKPHLSPATSLRGSDAVIPESSEFEPSDEGDEEVPKEVAAMEVRGEVSNEEIAEAEGVPPETTGRDHQRRSPGA